MLVVGLNPQHRDVRIMPLADGYNDRVTLIIWISPYSSSWVHIFHICEYWRERGVLLIQHFVLTACLSTTLIDITDVALSETGAAQVAQNTEGADVGCRIRPVVHPFIFSVVVDPGPVS